LRADIVPDNFQCSSGHCGKYTKQCCPKCPDKQECSGAGGCLGDAGASCSALNDCIFGACLGLKVCTLNGTSTGQDCSIADDNCVAPAVCTSTGKKGTCAK
jgi:hypothetical protein